MSTPESEVGTTVHRRVSPAWWVACVVVLVAAHSSWAPTQRRRRGHRYRQGLWRHPGHPRRPRRGSQSAEPTPLITTYAPGRLILKR
jgi:hypothetical protein